MASIALADAMLVYPTSLVVLMTLVQWVAATIVVVRFVHGLREAQAE